MESFIIQDFKLFAPARLGEKDTWVHLDTGASGNMVAAFEAQGVEETERRMVQSGIGQQEAKQVRIGSL